MRIKPCPLIESECGFVLSACQQHDLVTIVTPCIAESVHQDRLTPTSTAMRRMRDDGLDYAVRTASAREIWNNRERTAGNEQAGTEPSKIFDSRVRQSLQPNRLGYFGRRRWIVMLVQMRIQTEQRLELMRLEFADVHERPNG